MLAYKTYILSTRPLPNPIITMAAEKGVGVDSYSFIETDELDTLEVQQAIAAAALQTETVVFTSMNAVESVIHKLKGQIPDWNIYCMGHTTKELAAAYFGEKAIVNTGIHALQLADAIIETGQVETVLFFCGNRRRAELPQQLAAAKIAVREVVVYETRNLTHPITRAYDGILFFSPSAVESFFSQHQLPVYSIVFAIGTTTEAAVKNYCNNQIIVGQSPEKALLAAEAVQFFSELHQPNKLP